MAARIPDLKSRPELGPSVSAMMYDHQYEAKYRESNALSKIVQQVQHCHRAAEIILCTEQQLFRDEVLHSNRPSLPTLEKGLLDLSHSLTQGIFYATCLRNNETGDILVRYFESGCYNGFMNDIAEEEFRKKIGLNKICKLKVYTSSDIKQTNQDEKESARPNQQYKRMLISKKSAVVPQLMLFREYMSKAKNLTLMCMVVHCLKKNANPSCKDDRYISSFPESEQCAQDWSDRFSKFILSGNCAKEEETLTQVLESGDIPTNIYDQFNFLNALPNNHWAQYVRLDGKLSNKDGKVSFLQHLAYQQIDNEEYEMDERPKTSYLPTSLRNRLIYFMCYEKDDYVRTLCQFLASQILPKPSIIDSNDECSINIPETSQPPTKRRKYTPRVVKVTPAMIGKTTQVQTSLYTSFSERLVTDGIIMLRMKNLDGGVFVMNDYSTESGCILPLSYCHVSFSTHNDRFFFHCTCNMYSFLQHVGYDGTNENNDDIVLDQSMTCMHCRFTNEHLLPICKGQDMADLQQPISKKLQAHTEKFNSPVIALETNKTIKFTVKGEDSTCSFVHLSACRNFVSCQLGRCQISLRNKRKTTKLLALSEQDKVCEHLKTLYANQEEWVNFLPSETQDNNEEARVENMEDHNLVLNPEKTYFNTETNLWDFGGLSTHAPYPDMDITLAEKIRDRAKLIDGILSRDKDHFLTGHKLIAAKPNVCGCGAGYDDGKMQFMYNTRLFTRYGVVKTEVFDRMCNNGSCRAEYIGKADGIHQWTKEICCGDEIGWDFVNRVICSRTSFTSYVQDMTRIYKSSFFMSPQFMSVHTFISWLFSWMSAMKIDFRASVDPWCKHHPKYLAGDGTHVGVAVKYLKNNIAIETADLPETEVPNHKRYDRVFLPFDSCQDNIRSSRQHLLWHCKKTLSLPVDKINSDRERMLNETLLSVITDLRVKVVIEGFLERKYGHRLLHKLAYVLKALCRDAPVSAFLCVRYHDEMLNVLTNVKSGAEMGSDVFLHAAPEFHFLLVESIDSGFYKEISVFIEYLILFVQLLHRNDDDYPQAEAIPDTYNPEKGVAYYFTDHGGQVRKTPSYNISGSAAFDDRPQNDSCNKLYPSVSRGGFSYMFLWFCPIHGHSYGFHLISGAEGRKDPFFSMYKYLPHPPEEVFYDFACSLNEYSMNRAPSYAKYIRFWHDIFHGFGHKCPFCFRSARLNSLNANNTEICEQFNAFIQCIKYTASHLSQSHFCMFMQFFIHIWNKRKTRAQQKKIDVALACAL